MANDLISPVQDRDHPRPFVVGKNLARWHVPLHHYLEYGTDRAPALFRRPTFPELYAVAEKLISLRLAGQRPCVAYDDGELLHNHTALAFVSWHRLAGTVNKSISKSAKYRTHSVRGSREGRETVSRRFHLKYILALMNSSLAESWLATRRRNNKDIYPDDWKPFPVADVPLDGQRQLVELVDAILNEHRQHDHPLSLDLEERVKVLERQIDEHVYGLYGLTDDEIRRVEGG